MSNPRRIRLRATRALAEAWDQEIRRQVTTTGEAVAEVRIREPLKSLVGEPTLLALTAALSRTEGWEQDAEGVFRHELDGGYISFDPSTCELEIVASASVTVEATGAGVVTGTVEAEAVGTYYDDGWGGLAEEAARRQAEEAARRQAEEAARRQAEEAARRQAEEAARRLAEEAHDAAWREAGESTSDEVYQQAQRAAEASLAAATAARAEELRKQAAAALASVGSEGRTVFHRALSDAYRDAILAYARAQRADGIHYTDSGDVLEIEFRTADLSYPEAEGGVRTKFRFKSDVGEVELFEVEDLHAGPPSAYQDARLERAADAMARIVEIDALIEEAHPGIPPSSVRTGLPSSTDVAETPAEGTTTRKGAYGEEQATESLPDEQSTSQQVVPPTRAGAAAERRYLRARFPEKVPAGRAFSVLVSIVQSLPTGGASKGGELKLFDVPSEGRDVLLIVHAPGLRFLGEQRQLVHVPRDRDSEPVMFELQAETPGPTQVSITAWLGGSYLGELLVEIAAEHDGPLGPDHDMLAEVNTGSAAGAVSLVVRFDPRQQAYRFEFRDDDFPDEVVSQLAYDPGPLVEHLIADLDALAKGRGGYSADQTRSYLVNAGAKLWSQLVPAQLREQFWDRQHRIRQLTILADKDTVPWELLYPMDPGHDAGFLVEQFPVTRAIFGRRPTRRLNLRPAWFVLPEDSLPQARDEINGMRRLLDPGQPPSEVISALTPLQDLIANGNFGLLHFACHNTYNPSDGPSIQLGNVQFTPTLMTTATINKVLEPSAPTIFINACRSAGLNATYNQLDGWASKFLEAGAGAFIGSLWAVSDGSAREFAQEFYGQLQAGFPLGKAVMQARQVAATQLDDPTWLAYTVYGDPRATLSQQQS